MSTFRPTTQIFIRLDRVPSNWLRDTGNANPYGVQRAPKASVVDLCSDVTNCGIVFGGITLRAQVQVVGYR